MDYLETIYLDGEDVVIIDQNLLPSKEEYTRLTDIDEVYRAIKNLQVRGAPAIGIAAAMGIYVHMRNISQIERDIESFARDFDEGCKYLSSSRPTAVNLNWALARMRKVFEKGGGVAEVLSNLRKEAEAIKRDDTEVCKKIGEYGAKLLKPNAGVLTHCNAGSLATSKYGTALAPIYVAHEQGRRLRVYADETRPVLQGARLTAFELHRAGVDITLICDNMAAYVMAKGLVDVVFVGCDRVAKNGDTANKIGTLGVAILAKNYDIPFYVCAPFSTIDPDTATGDGIKIEERDGAEITDLWYKEKMAPAGVKTFNPAFDVTPAKFITGYITEKGILEPPFDVHVYTDSVNIGNGVK